MGQDGCARIDRYDGFTRVTHSLIPQSQKRTEKLKNDDTGQLGGCMCVEDVYININIVECERVPLGILPAMMLSASVPAALVPHALSRLSPESLLLFVWNAAYFASLEWFRHKIGHMR